MDETDDEAFQPKGSGSWLVRLINSLAISADDAYALARSYRQRSERRYPDDIPEAHRDRIARAIIKRYAKMAAISGGATALPETVPGIGTALAILGGGSVDVGVCLKLQVDMCRCLAACYNYDLTSEDAKHISMLLAFFGTIESLGGSAGAALGTKAGVSMLRMYLRGTVLRTLKGAFSSIGVKFTRKALEKSTPFGIDIIIGAGINYGITHYVGNTAKAWFQLDQAT